MQFDHETLVYMTKVCGALGAGLSMGFGAIGSSYGIGATAQGALVGIVRQPKAAGDLTKMMLIGAAVTESPAIFALVTSILLVFIEPHIPHLTDANYWEVAGKTIAHCSALIGAGLCMGWGAFGPGIGDGVASEGGCIATARVPEERSSIMKTMLIGQATAQSTSVYAFVISLCLIFLT